MSKKRKKEDTVLSADDFADELMANTAFRCVVEQAYINYVEPGGKRDGVNIAVTIISDGVTPPTLAIAADRFNLTYPRE